MLCASKRETSSNASMLFYSSKLCFFVRLGEAEVHRLRPIELTKGVRRVWVIPMGAKTGCLKVELSVQRDIHSHLKGGGGCPEYFRSSHARAKTLHEDGNQNHFW